MKHVMSVGAAAAACLLVGGQARAQMVPDPQAMVRQAVQKSVPVMLSSAGTFQERMGKVCFSCHHQSVPSAAYAAARKAGIEVDQARVQGQSDYVYGSVARLQPLLMKAVREKDAAAEKQIDRLTVDPTISVAYTLFGLEQDGRKPDALLNMAAAYLAKKQAEDGRWPVWFARPPLEGSEFTATALAVRALKVFGASDASEEMEKRIATARAWLVATPAKTNEDAAFRLLGLKWSGAPEEEVRKAAKRLLDAQQDDGGWGQLAGKGSDAYATGQALYALHEGAGLPVTDAVYTRGAFFLVASQKPDGSWLVEKRANPVQPYLETNFPGGQNQFISITGSAWATAALAMSVEPPAVRSASR